VDAVEMREMIRTIAYIDGPFYLRTGRTKYPTLLPEDYEFRLGRAPVIRDGDDITIMAIGLMVEKALKAASDLKAEGISARVVNMSSIKPLDHQCIHTACKETAGIVTVEEHNRVGGLGSRIAAEVVKDKPVPMRFVAVDDTFGRSGDVEGLFQRFGLTDDNIVEKVRDIMKRRE
jgi:transketolase